MALQNAREAAQVLETWFLANPSIAKTDENIAALTQFIAANFQISGETVIDQNYLNLAALSLGTKLQYLADPSTTARIQQVSQQALESQQRLADELAEKNRQAEALEREQLREQRQRSHGPGVVSAFGNGDDAARRATEEQQARQAVRSQAEKNAAYAVFKQELARANQILVTMPGGSMVSWGKTTDARASAKAELRKRFEKYPDFLREIA